MPSSRTKRLELRLSAADKAEIERRAKEQDLSVSEYLRQSALGRNERAERAFPQAKPKTPGPVSRVFGNG